MWFSLFATHLPPQFLKSLLNKEKGVNTLNNQRIHSQYLFMTFLLVLFFQRDQQNVQPSFQYHARRSAMLACKRYQRYFDCMKDIVKNDAT